ncbi:MAG: hypothetical protein CVU77_05130 [Elusimicrobia bacterium HGW-Elusimicrobia-1]|jgi:iron complex outermembrane receptor protein|nr:MAG: hypothetical protein CVU77_05130 [Elusimicrobia bacterium HGW-Elusimicrobia-1]
MQKKLFTTSAMAGILVLAFAVVPFLSGRALGAQEEITEEELFFKEIPIVVTASKKEQPISESPSTIYVITEEDIKNSAAETFADLLRSVPGVQVRKWLAEYSNITVRGMIGAEVVSTRILWLMDGIRINDVRDGGVWQDICFPLDMIKRIEIILGPGSALYGSNAFQGVINIITKSPKDINKDGEYFTSYGSFNTWKTGVIYGKETGDFSLMINGSVNRTDGPELLPNRHTPKYEPHSKRKWHYLRTKMRYKDLTVSLGQETKITDFSGAEFFPSSKYGWDRAEHYATFIYAKPVSDKLDIKAELDYRTPQEYFYDYSDFVGLTALTREYKWENNIQFRYRPIEANEIMLGLGYRQEWINADEFRTGMKEHTINNPNAFIQNELRVKDNLTVTAGLRFDTHERYENQFSPRISFLYKPSQKSFIRTSYGRAFREPANWQLYIDQVDALGNPDLKPESLDTYECGFGLNPFDNLSFRLDTFYTRIKNIISDHWDPTIPGSLGGKFHPTQAGLDGIFKGFEFETKAKINTSLSGFLNYSYLIAEDEEGKELQYDAKHKANCGANWKYRHITVSCGLHYVGETIDTSFGTREVKSYIIPELKAQVEPYKGLLLSLSGWNIGHSGYYEMLGVPAPGQTYTARISYQF